MGKVVKAAGSPEALLAASAKAGLLVKLVDEAPCPVAVLSPDTATNDSG